MQITFKEALKKELQRCHSLEWHLFDSLKVLEGSAQNPDLKAALAKHREETAVHMQRLETIGAKLKLPVVGVPNLPARALAVELLEDWGGAEPGPMTDALIIEAAQKGEHLEMAWYGFLSSWCRQLGDAEVVALLEQTLEDEKRTDELLTKIAESGVNQAAAAAQPSTATPVVTATSH